MELELKARRTGSRGLSKVTLLILGTIIIGGIYILSKLGPVYQDKWKFEDRMGEDLARMASLHNEGIIGELSHFTEKNNIPCEPEKQCQIFGEEGKPGWIKCNYDVFVPFPVMKEPYKIQMKAFAKRSWIPLTSN